MSEKPTDRPHSHHRPRTPSPKTAHDARIFDRNKRLSAQKTAHHERFPRHTAQNWLRFAPDRSSTPYLMFPIKLALFGISPSSSVSIRVHLWPKWLCSQKFPPNSGKLGKELE
jgi:hypothetical protein